MNRLGKKTLMFKNHSLISKHTHQIIINDHLCLGCGACVAICPSQALLLVNTHLTFDAAACAGCKNCLITCPTHALTIMIPATE
jgi:Fe-S-cluster-containing hydrogenase component 2